MRQVSNRIAMYQKNKVLEKLI